MSYYFSKNLNLTFDEAVIRITEALKTEGFGIVTEINMHATLKEKIQVDFKKYKILGACNPVYAHKALLAEDKVGSMLPCNVLVIEQGENLIEVAAINPIASMQAIVNPALGELAQQITDKLQRVVNSL